MHNKKKRYAAVEGLILFREVNHGIVITKWAINTSAMNDIYKLTTGSCEHCSYIHTYKERRRVVDSVCEGSTAKLRFFATEIAVFTRAVSQRAAVRI